MRFEHPSLLWLLLLFGPALAAFLWWTWRTRQRLIAQFVQSRLLAQLTVGVSATRQKIRLGLVAAALLLLVLVLARPQWGFAWEEARQRGLDIVIAIDTSRSMLAADVAPSRLDRAKFAALDLLRAARTDRLGLVAFAGAAFLQCPLTIDEGAFRQSLQALDTSIIPQGGTALAEAIRTAQTAFGDKNDNFKVLVLFTDGEDHDGTAVQTAREAAKDGLRIFTVGVGTPEGELLSLPDGKGGTEFLKDDQGNVVKSSLKEDLLRDIAAETGGFYMLLTGANTTDLLYERGLDPLPKSEFAARRVKRYHERYQWFLATAVLLLLLEMLLPDRRRARLSESSRPTSGQDVLRKVAGWLLVLGCLGCLSPPALQASASSARKAYESGNYAAAQLQYEKLLEKNPQDPRLHYNAGNAAHLAGDYEAAARHFQSALATEDLTLQHQAFYNLGNNQFRLGETLSELQEKQAAWQQAARHYDSALKLQAHDPDAAFNLEFVKRKLEELKQQQEQQQQQSDDSQEKDESQQDSQQQKDDSSQPQQQDQSGPGQEKKDDSQAQQDQPQPEKDSESKPQDDAQGKPEEKPSEENTPKESQDSKPGEDSQQKGAQEGKPQEQGEGQPAQAQPVTMTPEQARRLLESLQGEERTLIFLPPKMTNRTGRVLRNW